LYFLIIFADPTISSGLLGLLLLLLMMMMMILITFG